MGVTLPAFSSPPLLSQSVGQIEPRGLEELAPHSHGSAVPMAECSSVQPNMNLVLLVCSEGAGTGSIQAARVSDSSRRGKLCRSAQIFQVTETRSVPGRCERCLAFEAPCPLANSTFDNNSGMQARSPRGTCS